MRLPAESAEALRRLAVKQLRHPSDQAAWLVQDGLRRAGELPRDRIPESYGRRALNSSGKPPDAA